MYGDLATIILVAGVFLYIGAREQNVLGLGVVPGSKSSNVAHVYQTEVAAPGAPLRGVTSAAQVMATGTLDIGNAGGIVILVPNEGHHGPTDKQTMFPKNGVFVPERAIIPAGCEVVFLSDDEGHSHVISMGSLGQTKSISVNMASAPVRFTTPGTFSIASTKYEKLGQRGIITVTNMRPVANKVVGAIFVPASDVQKYTSAMSSAGCTISSQAPALKKASGQSVSEHMLLVYSATGTAAVVAQKLATVTKMTPYA